MSLNDSLRMSMVEKELKDPQKVVFIGLNVSKHVDPLTWLKIKDNLNRFIKMFLDDNDLISVQFSTCPDLDPPVTFKNRARTLDFSKHDFVLQDKIQQAIEERNDKIAD